MALRIPAKRTQQDMGNGPALGFCMPVLPEFCEFRQRNPVSRGSRSRLSVHGPDPLVRIVPAGEHFLDAEVRGEPGENREIVTGLRYRSA
jgi:hypothetical protein